MAVVKMRELLREPRPVFEELERSGEPVVLTRDGEAIAALFPIDREQAVEIAMAGLPEFVQSRDRARNARSEGRTAPGADFRREFESRHGSGGGEAPITPTVAAASSEASTGENSSGLGAEIEAALIENLKVLFGEEVSRELAEGVEDRIAAASEPVLDAAPREVIEQDVDAREFVVRVKQLNCELFGRLLPDALHRTTLDLLASRPLATQQHEGGGMLGRLLAERTLDSVTTRVRSFNCQLVDDRLAGQRFSLPIYEACVRGAQAIERLDAPADDPPQHRARP
jgi:antitoxin (DNA-binding transcriptional repressor) of toxin-antitoxin stability system